MSADGRGPSRRAGEYSLPDASSETSQTWTLQSLPHVKTRVWLVKVSPPSTQPIWSSEAMDVTEAEWPSVDECRFSHCSSTFVVRVYDR